MGAPGDTPWVSGEDPSSPVLKKKSLVGVAGTNFFFSEVDAFLTAIGSSVGASQLVSVVLDEVFFFSGWAHPESSSGGGWVCLRTVEG